jgi:hypothetical protein
MKSIFQKIIIACAFMALSLSSYAQGNHYYSNNTLTDPYGGFQLTFPVEPTYNYQDLETAVGTLRMYFFSYETSSVAYMMSYIDYPADKVALADKNEMLKGALNGYINNLKLSLQSEIKINYGNYPGLMFYANDGQKFSVIRDYLVDNRLYQLGILQLGQIPERLENEFFDSFVLIK